MGYKPDIKIIKSFAFKGSRGRYVIDYASTKLILNVVNSSITITRFNGDYSRFLIHNFEVMNNSELELIVGRIVGKFISMLGDKAVQRLRQ